MTRLDVLWDKVSCQHSLSSSAVEQSQGSPAPTIGICCRHTRAQRLQRGA